MTLSNIYDINNFNLISQLHSEKSGWLLRKYPLNLKIDYTAYMLYKGMCLFQGKTLLKYCERMAGNYFSIRLPRKTKEGQKNNYCSVHGNKDIPRGTIKSIEKQTGEKIL